MKKLFDERGFLTEEAKKSPQVIAFKRACEEMLKDAESLNDFQITGSILHKIVGDTVSDAMQHKRNETNKFSQMTDEEFENYLEDKYLPLFGEHWSLKASLSKEEFERYGIISKKKIEAAFEEMKTEAENRKRHYTGIQPRYRGRGKYID